MRGLLVGAAATLLTAGTALGQTAAPAAPTTTAAEPATAGASARTERVCKTEPIANSRLKSKKVCMSRAEYERVRNEQKLSVRDSMQRGGVQRGQGGS